MHKQPGPARCFPAAITPWHIHLLPNALKQQPHQCRTRPATASCTAAGHQAKTDEHFMGLALQQAQLAYEANEVPIGAVLVINWDVAAAAYNQTETRRNPLSHAELLCISAAAEQQLAWRLQEATLYSTVEPCPMCAGAILQARLARLVYGARQPRVGADGSWVAMFPQQQQQQQQPPVHQQPLQPVGPHPFHPDIQVTGGVLADECAALMKQFFRRRRKEQQAAKAAAAAAAGAAVGAAAGGRCTCHGDPQLPQAPAESSSVLGRGEELDAAVWLGSSSIDSSAEEV